MKRILSYGREIFYSFTQMLFFYPSSFIDLILPLSGLVNWYLPLLFQHTAKYYAISMDSWMNLGFLSTEARVCFNKELYWHVHWSRKIVSVQVFLYIFSLARHVISRHMSSTTDSGIDPSRRQPEVGICSILWDDKDYKDARWVIMFVRRLGYRCAEQRPIELLETLSRIRYYHLLQFRW